MTALPQEDGEGPEQEGRADKQPESGRRGGLPDEKSIVSEHTFVSPKGKRYRILRTTEKDEYEEGDRPQGDRPGEDKPA